MRVFLDNVARRDGGRLRRCWNPRATAMLFPVANTDRV
jgi:hypothetical protein